MKGDNRKGQALDGISRVTASRRLEVSKVVEKPDITMAPVERGWTE